MIVRLIVPLLPLLPLAAEAFVSPRTDATPLKSAVSPAFGRAPSALFGSREDDMITEAAETKGRGKAALDSGVRSKLLAESIAPWRTVRLFLYGALGSGAAVGGFLTAAGVAAALSGARTDVDLNTEYLNLAIDFGAAIAFAVFAKLDLDKAAELNENVEKKLDRKKEQKKVVKAMRKREEELSNLNLSIKISGDGQTQDAMVGVLQKSAKQHMIIVAGPKKACKDALMGAQLGKMNFALSNILVVPYETGVDEAEKRARPSGGFGERPVWEKQLYVAEAVGDGWKEYIDAEMADAVEQSGEKAKEEGIAIVMANNGKVIRRGVGLVPWKEMIDQLEQEVSPEEEEEEGFARLL